jgi:hypothetical protein
MAIYQVSRSLYRHLSAELTGPPETGVQQRRRVLDACEMTMSRIEQEPDFAKPARFLFEEVRLLFPVWQQGYVRCLIERHVELAQLALSLAPPTEQPCAAHTRKGSPCRRAARPESRYCPSHRHLDSMVETPATALTSAA